MSVVLALGLSPIGQAPAYAAQKADKQPAQQEQVLQTQADTTAPTWLETFSVKYSADKIVYKGTPYLQIDDNDVILNASGVSDNYLFGYNTGSVFTYPVRIYHTNQPNAAASANIDYLLTSGSQAAVTDVTQQLVTYFPKAELTKDGVKTKVAKDAGNYVLTLKGAGSHEGDDLVVNFTIEPFDLGAAYSSLSMAGVSVNKGGADGIVDVPSTAINPNAAYTWTSGALSVGSSLKYLGKAQTVAYDSVLQVTKTEATNDGTTEGYYKTTGYATGTKANECYATVAEIIAAGKTPAYVYPTVTVANTFKYNNAVDPIVLKQGDFDFVEPTVTYRGGNSVSLVGKGNFTGEVATKATVGTGEFATYGNTSVCGVTNSLTDADFETAVQDYYTTHSITNPTAAQRVAAEAYVLSQNPYKATITLTGTEKSPTVADPDPVANGKVFFGEQELAKGDDFTVKYFTDSTAYSKYSAYLADNTKTEGKPLDSFPTALGTGYVAELTAVSSDFTNGVQDKIVVTYDVTGTEKLSDLVAKADFGTATYVAGSEEEAKGGAQHVTSDAQGALVIPSNVKFTSAAGLDVTGQVGSDYQLVSVAKWTDDMEREFLGADEYAKKYPHADSPYANTEGVTSAKDASFIEVGTKHTKVWGFNGLAAGDYQVTIQGTGAFKGGTVTGKLTVAKATASLGTAAGQIEVTPGKAGYNKGDAIVFDDVDNTYPTVKMITGKDEDGKSLYTDPLTRDTPLEVAKGNADFSVVFKKDGQVVNPAEAGSYDAVLTFGGNDYESGKVEVKDALVIGTPELSSVAKSAAVKYVDDNGANIQYMYTGSAVEPQIAFYTEDIYAMAKENDELWTADSSELTAITGWSGVTGPADITEALINAVTDEDLKADAQTMYDNYQYLQDPVEVTTLTEDDYTLSYRGVSDEASFAGGKPVGVGRYQVTVKGAGKYTSSEGKELVIPAVKTAVSGDPDYGFNIGKLKFRDDPKAVSPDATIAKYTTVQFKDGDAWTEDYSATMDGATELEPEVRVVTTATKGDASPVEIPSKLYKVSYSANTGVGEAGVFIYGTDADLMDLTVASSLPSGVNKAGQAGYYKFAEREASFYIADGKFSDVNAAIVLGAETAEYTGKNVAPSIKVKTNNGAGTELAVQTATSTSGQYKWTITDADGKEVAKSTDTAVEQAADGYGAIDAGEYTVTVSGGQTHQYAGTLTAKFTVTPKEIKATDSKLTVTYFNGSDDNYKMYADGDQWTAIKYVAASGGTPASGDVKYKVDGTNDTVFAEVESADKASKVAGGTAYTVTGHQAKDAGSYTATIEFCGNYTGKVEKAWRITPVDISSKQGTADYTILAKADNKELKLAANSDVITEAQLKAIYNVDYDGTEHRPEVTVYKTAGMTPVQGLSYTYLYDKCTDATAGKANAKVTIIADGGNYTGRMDCYFAINGLEVGGDRLNVTFSDDELAYTGRAVEPKGTATYTLKSGKVIDLAYGKDYVVQEYTGDNVNVGGQAYAKVVGLAPNFAAGTDTFVQVPFSVQAAPAEQEITASDVSLAYGATKKVNASAKTELTYVPDNSGVYSVDAAGNVKALKVGTGKLTVKAAATDEFKAAEKTITVKVTKAKNTAFKVTAKKKAYAAKTSAKKVFKASALYKVTGKAGKVTYKKANTAGAKKIVVAKNGKITVKKGLKAGTYKVKVKATSAANANYKAASKNVTIKVKVTKK